MNKYLRAISSNLIFFTINAVFFLVITPVLIRVMGEEFYGLWTILMALMLGVFWVFAAGWWAGSEQKEDK